MIFVLCPFDTRVQAETTAAAAPLWSRDCCSRKTFLYTVKWIGTLTGHVMPTSKRSHGLSVTRTYKEGSYVKKAQPLFEIDPRPFQAAPRSGKGH